MFILVAGINIHCKKEKGKPAPLPANLSYRKDIAVFDFKKADNAALLENDVVGIFQGDTIKLVVPIATNLTSIKPAITFNGVSIEPVATSVQDFSSPVRYTVKAENGSVRKYIVIAKFRPMVYVASLDGLILAHDAIDGKRVWKIPFPLTSSSPAVGSGLLFINSFDSLYAFDARNGTLKWRKSIGSSQYTSRFSPSPVYENGTLYTASFDGSLYAMEPTSGAIKWQFSNPSRKAFASSFTFRNNTIYIGADDSTLYSIDANAGTVKWKRRLGGVVFVRPAVDNGIVYASASNNRAYAINSTSGVELWNNEFGGYNATIAAANGTLYVTRGRYLFALDGMTGAVKWQREYYPSRGGFSYNERSTILVKDDVLYLGSLANQVAAFSAIDGDRVWTVDLYGSVYASPTLANGMIYIGSEAHYFTALDAVTGHLKWSFNTYRIWSSACVTDENGVVYYSALRQ
jgi:eukaryotic-like serine/threonine-protein kinase